MSLPKRRRASIGVLSALALACAVTPARSDDKEDARVLALQQSAIAAGKRTVTVVAEGKATRKVDSLVTHIMLKSGRVLRGNGPKTLAAFEERMVETLRTAGLPIPPTDTEGFTQPTSSRSSAPAEETIGSYRVPVASLDEHWKIVKALEALTPDYRSPGYNRQEVRDEPTVYTVEYESKSSELEADRPAVQLEARQNALANAKTMAAQNAAAIGMKLGPPLLVGPLNVTSLNGNSATELGYAATGTVVFELAE